jgi:hypothetical protein
MTRKCGRLQKTFVESIPSPQSGGLGVPGSNPGASTKILKYFKYFIGVVAQVGPMKRWLLPAALAPA